MQTSMVIMYPEVVVKEEKVIQKEVHLGPNFRKKKRKKEKKKRERKKKRKKEERKKEKKKRERMEIN